MTLLSLVMLYCSVLASNPNMMQTVVPFPLPKQEVDVINEVARSLNLLTKMVCGLLYPIPISVFICVSDLPAVLTTLNYSRAASELLMPTSVCFEASTSSRSILGGPNRCINVVALFRPSPDGPKLLSRFFFRHSIQTRPCGHFC